MSRKRHTNGNGGVAGIGTNTTVTIGTALAVIGGIVWLTWYAGGIVRDVDDLKGAVAVIQQTLNRIENKTR